MRDHNWTASFETFDVRNDEFSSFWLCCRCCDDRFGSLRWTYEPWHWFAVILMIFPITSLMLDIAVESAAICCTTNFANVIGTDTLTKCAISFVRQISFNSSSWVSELWQDTIEWCFNFIVLNYSLTTKASGDHPVLEKIDKPFSHFCFPVGLMKIINFKTSSEIFYHGRWKSRNTSLVLVVKL